MERVVRSWIDTNRNKQVVVTYNSDTQDITYEVSPLDGNQGVINGGAPTDGKQNGDSLGSFCEDTTLVRITVINGAPYAAQTRETDSPSCQPTQACDLLFGAVSYPSTGAYSISFTTTAGDGKIVVYPTGDVPGTTYVSSPYQGTGTPGSTIYLTGSDRNGCSAPITIVLPATPPPPAADPILTLVTKNQGYIGDTVVLTGTLFTGASKVTFSGVSASYTVLSDTSIQTSVPVGTVSGPVQVEVGAQYTNTLPFTLLVVVTPPVVVTPSPAIDGWTISWQLDFNSWTGEHTTIPDWYLPRNLDTYRVLAGKVVKQTSATYGLPLTLQGIANWEPLRQKTYDGLVLEQEIRDFSLPQPLLRHTTFSKVSLNTDFHHTGNLTPFVPTSYQDKWNRILDPTQVAASFEKDQYNLEIPGSVVVDVDKSISDPANWNLTQSFKPRLSGKWAQYSLTFQGTPTQKLVLHTLRVLSRLILR